MKRRNGFTLMELLLVVAILAIVAVAAAAAPTFSGGASDALKEARKSAFLAAYQNTVTGAHMMIALAASKGYDVKNKSLDTNGIIPDDENATTKTYETYKLNYYSPVATRQFKNNAGEDYTLGAYVENDHNLVITYAKAKTAPTDNTNKIAFATTDSSTEALNKAWNTFNGEE